MIGKKLKELLKEKDIKQIRLAEAVGISPSWLSNYLSDKREPDLDILARITRRIEFGYTRMNRSLLILTKRICRNYLKYGIPAFMLYCFL